jgi:hypothetical protein
VDGYYGLANPSHIGEGYNDTKYKKTLKVLPAWYGDGSEPFLLLRNLLGSYWYNRREKKRIQKRREEKLKKLDIN